MVFILIFIDNRLEELQKKYNQEVEERKKLETELKVLQVKVSLLCFYFSLHLFAVDYFVFL